MYSNGEGDGSCLCGEGWGWGQDLVGTVGDAFQVYGDDWEMDSDGDKLSSLHSSLHCAGH